MPATINRTSPVNQWAVSLGRTRTIPSRMTSNGIQVNCEDHLVAPRRERETMLSRAAIPSQAIARGESIGCIPAMSRLAKSATAKVVQAPRSAVEMRVEAFGCPAEQNGAKAGNHGG